MSGVIFALVEHPASAPPLFVAACSLAVLMGSCRINVLAVRVPPETTIIPSEEVLTPRRATDIRAREQKRINALRVAFEGWAASARRPELTIEWADVEGLADSLVGEWGRRSDILVMNRPAPRDLPVDRLAMQAALFDTDRPVLVVPSGPGVPFGECVAIAWRPEKRTERAVLTALRLLPRGKPVHVLAGVKPGAAAPVLPEILAEHGIAAQLHALPIGAAPFGEMLLAKAHEIGADLLVMGAYTHNAWRDMMLGGVTSYVLAHAKLPVLMRH
jgi:nucleotide-binding universal stress UspA family protein